MDQLPIGLHHGDCLQVLRTLPESSVHACVTDPPYGLSFMLRRWDYDVPTAKVWREVYRVLKPGAHLLAFAGTRTQHRMTVNIEDAGFEIRDMIAWVYGSGFPKSHNLKGEWDGWGTALKPALEPITMARKPFKGTVAANMAAHSVSGLNIDGCRIAGEVPRTTQGQAASAGTIYNKDQRKLREFEPHVAGRWPANLLHDGSEEVVSLFPGAARFFYCPKASKAERGKENNHPTVKPLALMAYLCRLVTPAGGVVLDPFAGSGTTGIAARQEGFQFLGIESELEYVELARKRLRLSEAA